MKGKIVFYKGDYHIIQAHLRSGHYLSEDNELIPDSIDPIECEKAVLDAEFRTDSVLGDNFYAGQIVIGRKHMERQRLLIPRGKFYGVKSQQEIHRIESVGRNKHGVYRGIVESRGGLHHVYWDYATNKYWRFLYE